MTSGWTSFYFITSTNLSVHGYLTNKDKTKKKWVKKYSLNNNRHDTLIGTNGQNVTEVIKAQEKRDFE